MKKRNIELDAFEVYIVLVNFKVITEINQEANVYVDIDVKIFIVGYIDASN